MSSQEKMNFEISLLVKTYDVRASPAITENLKIKYISGF